MKRQELKALLHGVENAGEIIDQIMEINGADIENAKKEKSGGNEALNREIERLKCGQEVFNAVYSALYRHYNGYSEDIAKSNKFSNKTY